MMKEAHFTIKVLVYKIEDLGKVDIVIFQECCLLQSQNNSAKNNLHYAKCQDSVSSL